MSVAALPPPLFDPPRPCFILPACISHGPLNFCFSTITAGTASCRNSATQPPNGPNSPLSACSPAARPLWAFDATAAHHHAAHIRVFSLRPANQRHAAAADSRPPSSGSPRNSTFFPTATGSTSPSPCPTCSGHSLTTTGPCSTPSFAELPAQCSASRERWALKSASSARYTPTADSSTNIPIFTSPSLAAE